MDDDPQEHPMGLPHLHRHPILLRPCLAASSAVAGLEPELVEVSGVEGDRRGDFHEERSRIANSQQLRHSAGALAPGFEAGGSDG